MSNTGKDLYVDGDLFQVACIVKSVLATDRNAPKWRSGSYYKFLRPFWLVKLIKI